MSPVSVVGGEDVTHVGTETSKAVARSGMTAVPELAGVDSSHAESIEELFAALESPLLVYALRLVAERAPAEDVVQEAFMKLHSQWADVRQPRRWLYRTVHNLALNYRRNVKVIPLAPTAEDGNNPFPESIDPELLPDERIIRGESIGLVRLSLGALDDRSREVVQLKFDEDLSYKQIAERTGLTATHVGYLLHHALKTIAAKLAHTGLLP